MSSIANEQTEEGRNLERSSVTDPIEEVCLEEDSKYQCGEHVACVWTDVGESMNWHLGVVDRYDNDTGVLYVSYMKKTDNKRINWLFPEEAEIHHILPDQVIARNISVRYSLMQ